MDVLLPKVYLNDASGNYPQHVGKPKISYSQYQSWISTEYRPDYIRSYFLDGPRTTNIYAEFGSACGTYLESLEVDEAWLTENDVEVLNKVPRPENAIYEGEIVIDRGHYVIQGFIDIEYIGMNGKLNIQDFKTGNADTKAKYYGGDDYQQTTLYCFAREVEGYEIDQSGVVLLGRKGNNVNGNNLRLSGVIKKIPTPYSKERAMRALAHIDVAVFEISNAFKLFEKLNNLI